MSDEGDSGRARADDGDRRPPSSSRDLLDLVRSAEDDARLALRKRTPAIATTPAGLPTSSAGAARGESEEEFVDVGDEAIDAPPSLPPLRAATPPAGFTPDGSRPRAVRAPIATSAPTPSGRGAPRGLPPAVGIVLLVALAIGTLALVAR
ncbi:MAG: hypothetical protein KF764_30050 [Labilithrix sp.]|nr:hypothetical protein [Labilithrix sp.]MBX3221393.1 hypothetical protein [Labilithrix sp.]